MEYVSPAIVGLLGLIIIWINLFGGEVSYSSKGALPQVREFVQRRKERRELEKWYREIKKMPTTIGIVLPNEVERMRKELKQQIDLMEDSHGKS